MSKIRTEQIILAEKAYKKKHKEKIKEQMKEWRAKNKESITEYNKEWKTKQPNYHTNRHLQLSYGISLDEYNNLLKTQDYKCLGCGVHSNDALRGKLFVDHCHNTNKVRGLLCQKCNTALGMVDDNIDTLTSLIHYLNRE
jgi:hypothetical protein